MVYKHYKNVNSKQFYALTDPKKINAVVQYCALHFYW